MGVCNFCKFQVMKRKATLMDMKAVASKRLAEFGLGGVRVYVVPKKVSIRSLSDEELSRYDAGTWFMELTKECVC